MAASALHDHPQPHDPRCAACKPQRSQDPADIEAYLADIDAAEADPQAVLSTWGRWLMVAEGNPIAIFETAIDPQGETLHAPEHVWQAAEVFAIENNLREFDALVWIGELELLPRQILDQPTPTDVSRDTLPR
jgi:hypothetical protein